MILLPLFFSILQNDSKMVIHWITVDYFKPSNDHHNYLIEFISIHLKSFTPGKKVLEYMFNNEHTSWIPIQFSFWHCASSKVIKSACLRFNRWPLGYLILQGSRRYFLAALGLVYPLNRFLSDTWSSKPKFLAFCSFVFSHSESYNCTLHWEFQLIKARNRRDKNALKFMEKTTHMQNCGF